MSSSGPPRYTLIVGASASIGPAIVDTFVKHGNRVIATYNANKPSLEGGAEWVKLDLASVASIKALTSRCPSLEKAVNIHIFHQLPLADHFISLD